LIQGFNGLLFDGDKNMKLIKLLLASDHNYAYHILVKIVASILTGDCCRSANLFIAATIAESFSLYKT